jgi:hypothetical protein
MALTPRKLTRAVRMAGAAAGAAALFALTGPFHWSDLGMPFPDFIGHGMLFYGLAGLMMAALPRSRTFDLAVGLVVIAAGSELLQSLVGRDMGWSDLLGDSAGVAAAVAPTYLAGFRRLVREHPDATLSELRALDRRRGRRAARPAEQPAAR